MTALGVVAAFGIWLWPVVPDPYPTPSATELPPLPTDVSPPTYPDDTVIIRWNPNCSLPQITPQNNVVIRSGLATNSKSAAQQSKDGIRFRFTLDGEVLKAKTTVSPIQTQYNDEYGCGAEVGTYLLYWDVNLGQLAPGQHLLTIEYIVDNPIIDGSEVFEDNTTRDLSFEVANRS